MVEKEHWDDGEPVECDDEGMIVLSDDDLERDEDYVNTLISNERQIWNT